MNETTNEMKIFKVQFPYNVTLDIEGDNGLTKLTIETISEEIIIAKSEQDAHEQKLLTNSISGDGYKNHILNFVRDEISRTESSQAKIKYTDEPKITLMNDDELQDFERDVISLNN